MTVSKDELIQYVNENDVKFVKLTFCDMFGHVRNISITASQLVTAFSAGVRIDSVAVTGKTGRDYILMPLAALLSELPWRPKTGRVISLFCEVRNTDGTTYRADSLTVLNTACELLSGAKLNCTIGTECEFYAFTRNDNGKFVPFDDGGYCDCAPIDACENLRREVILSMENMGLQPLSSHHERGRGQNEIDFSAAAPLNAARNFIMFKAAVKNVCAVSGARASFMPKPMPTEIGSGLHLLFDIDSSQSVTDSFLEGVLNRFKEISCFANPIANSYARLGKSRPIFWSDSDKRAAVRRINKTLQIRTPDSACNPFILFALIITAGIEGIEGKMHLRPEGEKKDVLFASIDEMLDYAEQSEWLKSILGETFVEAVNAKREESKIVSKLNDAQLLEYYFGI